ncbi:undecaprenyl-diphosphate phosphatase [Rossellomorea oryzaecorticis]|uniref:Undecaprenyl-diphosphatase n=1 Tax=Rossellomorea oryzaecorticis TaxID=1396505 RepID=A0ABU9K661_9BACI
MDIYTLLKAIVLGFVEGATEFAPISSTGHMIIVDDVWLKSREFLGKYAANTFKVVIQLGSILAVVVIFRERFVGMLDFAPRGSSNKSSEPKLKLSHVIVGLLPAGVLGVVFEDYIDENLFSINTVLIGLFLGSIFMIVADVAGSKKKGPVIESVDGITHKQAFIVGLVQCLALWPGFSRSGSTISGGVLLGMTHRAAADFTFIMAVPIMLGASVLSLIKNWQYFTIDALPFMSAGFISAFIFALVSIKFFLKLINKVKLIPFAIYRIILVLVIYVLYF